MCEQVFHLNNFEKNLSKRNFVTCENQLANAQRDFTDHLFQSTAVINPLISNLCKHRKEALDYRNNNISKLHDYCMSTTNDSRNIDKLQNELAYSIHKKVVSIKRSLLQLRNIANQHHLITMPYCELKALYGQIVQYLENQVPIEEVPKKLSYVEALQDLMQLLNTEESIENHTVSLINNVDTINQEFYEDACRELEEYKSLPNKKC